MTTIERIASPIVVQTRPPVSVQTPTPQHEALFYTKDISEMELAGNPMEFKGFRKISNSKVRVKTNGHKPVVSDTLAATGRFEDASDAARAITMMMESDRNPLRGIKSLEKDYTLQRGHLAVRPVYNLYPCVINCNVN